MPPRRKARNPRQTRLDFSSPARGQVVVPPDNGQPNSSSRSVTKLKITPVPYPAASSSRSVPAPKGDEVKKLVEVAAPSSSRCVPAAEGDVVNELASSSPNLDETSKGYKFGTDQDRDIDLWGAMKRAMFKQNYALSPTSVKNGKQLADAERLEDEHDQRVLQRQNLRVDATRKGLSTSTELAMNWEPDGGDDSDLYSYPNPRPNQQQASPAPRKTLSELAFEANQNQNDNGNHEDEDGDDDSDKVEVLEVRTPLQKRRLASKRTRVPSDESDDDDNDSDNDNDDNDGFEVVVIRKPPPKRRLVSKRTRSRSDEDDEDDDPPVRAATSSRLTRAARKSESPARPSSSRRPIKVARKSPPVVRVPPLRRSGRKSSPPAESRRQAKKSPSPVATRYRRGKSTNSLRSSEREDLEEDTKFVRRTRVLETRTRGKRPETKTQAALRKLKARRENKGKNIVVVSSDDDEYTGSESDEGDEDDDDDDGDDDDELEIVEPRRKLVQKGKSKSLMKHTRRTRAQPVESSSPSPGPSTKRRDTNHRVNKRSDTNRRVNKRKPAADARRSSHKKQRNKSYDSEGSTNSFVVEDDEEDDGEERFIGHPEIPLQFTQGSHLTLKEYFEEYCAALIQMQLLPHNARHAVLKRPDVQLASRALDRRVDSITDSVLRSDAWRGKFLVGLRNRPYYHTTIRRNVGDGLCTACNRKHRKVDHTINFHGNCYDKQSFEDLDEDDSDAETGEHGELIPRPNEMFPVGVTCFARAQICHSFYHWRKHLYNHLGEALIAAGKMDEHRNLILEEGLMADSNSEEDLPISPRGRDIRRSDREKERVLWSTLVTRKLKADGVIKALWRSFDRQLQKAQEFLSSGHKQRFQ